MLLGTVFASSTADAAGAAPIAQLGVGDATVAEGDVGTNPVRVTVTLAQAVPDDTLITYTIAAGTTSAGSDFLARSGKSRIRAGRTFATVTVRTTGDTLVENDETIVVALTGAVTVGGASVPIADPTGIVTVRDDDPGAADRLAVGDASMHEGDAPVTPLRFTVTLAAPLAGDVTGRFTIVADSAQATDDFVARTGSFRIRAGRTSAVLTAKVVGDVVPETIEQLTIVLSSVAGATVTDATAIGSVVDDDPATTTAPGAPTITTLAAGPTNGMLVVNWDPPPDDGGSPITGYELEIARPSETLVGAYTGLGANVVCGSPGVTCTLRVRAVNAIGPGTWSEPVSETTWRAPAVVGDLAVSGGNHVVSAFWTVPVDAGDFPIIDYRVERSIDGTTFTFVAFASVRAATVSCPGERITCWIRVTARNSAGFGPPSVGSAVTWARPGAPTLVSIRRIGTSVGLSWTAPADDGGSAIFDYLGERTLDGGTTWTPVGSVSFSPPTCPVGVSCGFRIAAMNVVGLGPVSNVLTVGP